MNSIKDLEQFHFQCQQGMYFSEYLEFPNYVAIFSDTVEDSYWNYIAWLRMNSKEEFIEVWKTARRLFLKRNRVPSVYISPSSSLFYQTIEALPTFLEKAYTDAWMLLKEITFFTNYQYPTYVNIEMINSAIHGGEFVKTFNTAYKSDNPGDAYPNLPVYYGNALHRSFNRIPKGFTVEHYWVKVNGKPVGVASVLINRDAAGIYSVGTVLEYRKRGIGTSLIAYIVRSCLERNVHTVLLQTEYGAYAERWFKAMGFITVSLGTCYVESK